MTALSAIELSRLALPEFMGNEKGVLNPKASDPNLVQAFQRAIKDRNNCLKLEINKAAHSVVLAVAENEELDQIAAFYGIKRLMLNDAIGEEAHPNSNTMESDERLRLRSKLSVEALTQAGCEEAYLFHALSASPHVKDISILSDDLHAEKIKIVVLTDKGKGDGSAGDGDILVNVKKRIAQVQSVTDRIVVHAAKIVDYAIHAELKVERNVDTDNLIKSAKNDLSALVGSNHRLGKNIMRAEYFSVLYKPGVEFVRLLEPESDIAIGNDCAPYNAIMDDSEIDLNLMIRPTADLTFSVTQETGSSMQVIKTISANSPKPTT